MEHNNANQIYHNLLMEILEKGVDKEPSRGQEEGTRCLFGETTPMVFDLSLGVPVISTKKVWTKGIIEELLWFMRGETNVRKLRQVGVHIWDKNAYEFYQRCGGELSWDEYFEKVDVGRYIFRDLNNDQGETKYYFGDLNRMYGYQWRRKRIVTCYDTIETIDPLDIVIGKLINNPDSRQIVLNTYDTYDASHSALPPCHTMPLIFDTIKLSTSERYQIAEERLGEPLKRYNEQVLKDMNIPEYRLNAEMTQRSGDAFLGVPFNITSTALLVMSIAKVANMLPGKFIHKVSNAHIYNNHFDSVKEQLSRDTNVPSYFPARIKFVDDPYVPYSIEIDYTTKYGSIKGKMIT